MSITNNKVENEGNNNIINSQIVGDNNGNSIVINFIVTDANNLISKLTEIKALFCKGGEVLKC